VDTHSAVILRVANSVRRHLLVSLFIGLFISATEATAQEYVASVALVSADADSATLLLTASEPQLELISISSDGNNWYKLVSDNVALTRVLGLPSLPQVGVLLAIPEGAQLAITIEDFQSTVIDDRAIAPTIPPVISENIQTGSPLWQQFDQYIDRQFYTQNTLYPQSPVSIGLQGLLREQAVAQVLFHPVQVNPGLQQLRIFKMLRVRIDFDRPLVAVNESSNSHQVTAISSSNERQIESPFAALMQRTLINARQAGH